MKGQRLTIHTLTHRPPPTSSGQLPRRHPVLGPAVGDAARRTFASAPPPAGQIAQRPRTGSGRPPGDSASPLSTACAGGDAHLRRQRDDVNGRPRCRLIALYVSKHLASGLTPLVNCFIRDPAVSTVCVCNSDAPKLNECENREINSHRRTLLPHHAEDRGSRDQDFRRQLCAWTRSGERILRSVRRPLRR